MIVKIADNFFHIILFIAYTMIQFQTALFQSHDLIAFGIVPSFITIYKILHAIIIIIIIIIIFKAFLKHQAIAICLSHALFVINDPPFDVKADCELKCV